MNVAFNLHAVVRAQPSQPRDSSFRQSLPQGDLGLIVGAFGALQVGVGQRPRNRLRILLFERNREFADALGFLRHLHSVSALT
jgi:hypothetical protein